MKANGISESRTSVALTKESIAKLSAFAKAHNLRIYEMLGVFADFLTENAKLQTAIRDETARRQQAKLEGRRQFSHQVLHLRPELKQKLSRMSANDIERMLG